MQKQENSFTHILFNILIPVLICKALEPIAVFVLIFPDTGDDGYESKKIFY